MWPVAMRVCGPRWLRRVLLLYKLARREARMQPDLWRMISVRGEVSEL